MTQPILTIAIPTYNRAYYLDRQLEWAVHSISDRWNQIELIVSDNGSGDATPEVCARWQQQIGGGRLRVFRQPRNLGLPLNALHCIQQANGRYIWLVSDDDEILDHTFEWILQTVSNQNNDELSLIHLNGVLKDKSDKAILGSIYNFKNDIYENPGRRLLQECLMQGIFLTGLTCSVYHLRKVQAALARWPGIRKNLAFPIFLAGYAAAHGGMLVRAAPSIALVDDTTYFRPIWPVIDFYWIPEVYVKLLEEGYQKEFIRARILSNLNLLRFIVKFPLQFIKSIGLYLRALRL